MILNSYKLYLYMALFTVLIVARDILMFGVPNGLIIGVLLLMLYTLDFKNSWNLTLFIVPFLCGIPGYVILFASIMLSIKGPSLTKNQVIPFVIICILQIIDFWVFNQSQQYSSLLSFLSFLWFFFYSINLKADNIDIKESIICFGVGTLVTLTVIIINMINLYGLTLLLSGVMRSGALGIVDNDMELMEGHLALNANSLAYYALCAISSMAGIIDIIIDKKERIILVALMLCIATLGFLSFSRTYILSFGLLVIMFALTIPRRQKYKYIFLMVLLGIFMCSAFPSVVNIFRESMNQRMVNGNIETAGGRTILFNQYNGKWLSNIWYVLLGTGTINYAETLGMHKSIHCGLQQIWVCTGIIGLGIFSYAVVRSLKTKHHISFRYLVPFLVCLFFDQSIQFLTPYSLMLPIVPTILAYKLHKNVIV